MSGVFYDAQGVQSVAHPERGIARYVRELAAEVGRTAPGLVDGIVYDPTLPMSAALDELAAVAPLVPNDAGDLRRARVFHVASPFEAGRTAAALLPYPVRAAGARLVSTLYDLIPLAMHEEYLPTGIDRAFYRRGLELVRTCDAVLAISQATADDAVRLLGLPAAQVHVIGAGAGPQFQPTTRTRAEVARDLGRRFAGLEPGYVLLPIGMDPRKNWQLALAAYGRLDADLRRRHQLVVACRVDEEQRRRARSVTDALAVTDRVHFTGVVSDDDLVELYRGAELVVYPSRYEGFGLPPLEARLCGAPVLAGDNSSLREVVVDPAARFDADDADAMVAAVTRALRDDEWRRRLAEAPLPPFTWRLAAARTVEVYEDLLRRGPRAVARTRAIVVADGVTLPGDVAGGLPPDVVVFDDLAGPSPYGTTTVATRASLRAHEAAGAVRRAALVVADAPAATGAPARPSVDTVAVSALATWLATTAVRPARPPGPA